MPEEVHSERTEEMKRFWVGNHQIKIGHDLSCGLGIACSWMIHKGKRICYRVDIALLWWTIMIRINEGD